MHIVHISEIPLSKKKPLRWVMTYLFFSFPTVSAWVSDSPSAWQDYPPLWRDSEEILSQTQDVEAVTRCESTACLPCREMPHSALWAEAWREALRSFAAEQSRFSCLTSTYP